MKNIAKLRKQAQKQIKKDNIAFRSCWCCNPAHEHLKNAKYVIQCFECGHWYYKGQDITEE